MPTQVLQFTPTELSKTAKSFLDLRFQTEDYRGHWCDLDSLLEEMASGDTIFTGMAITKQLKWSKLTLADLPKGWWKLMGFSAKVERAMKAHWKKYPKGEITWAW